MTFFWQILGDKYDISVINYKIVGQVWTKMINLWCNLMMTKLGWDGGGGHKITGLPEEIIDSAKITTSTSATHFRSNIWTNSRILQTVFKQAKIISVFHFRSIIWKKFYAEWFNHQSSKFEEVRTQPELHMFFTSKDSRIFMLDKLYSCAVCF